MNIVDYLFTDWTPTQNCWWLVRDFYKKAFGVTIPNYSKYAQGLAMARVVKNAVAQPDWTRLDTPQDFCVVAMGRKEQITHVGIWIAKEEKILHLVEEQKGKVQSIEALKPYFNTFKFYKYEPANTPRT